MADSEKVSSLPSERERFEEWFEPDAENRRHLSFHWNGEDYDCRMTYLYGCWQGWKARATQGEQQ